MDGRKTVTAETVEDYYKPYGESSAEAFRECHIRCLPHLNLHDRFERVTLHFERVEVIAREVDRSPTFSKPRAGHCFALFSLSGAASSVDIGIARL